MPGLACLDFLQLLVHFANAQPRALGGRLLQIEIERRINAIALRNQIPLGKLGEQLVTHHVHEVRRLETFHVLAGHPQRRPRGFLGLLRT